MYFCLREHNNFPDREFVFIASVLYHIRNGGHPADGGDHPVVVPPLALPQPGGPGTNVIDQFGRLTRSTQGPLGAKKAAPSAEMARAKARTTKKAASARKVAAKTSASSRKAAATKMTTKKQSAKAAAGKRTSANKSAAATGAASRRTG